jgi:hypothetical protein
MDERIGVHRLHCRRHTADCRRASTHAPVRGQQECGPNPLARSSKRVRQGLPLPSTDLLNQSLRPTIEESIRPFTCFAQQIRNGR